MSFSGCRDCRTYVSDEDPETVLYVEEWEDASALKKRLRAGDLRVLMSAMELARDRPVVRLEHTKEFDGIRLLAREG